MKKLMCEMCGSGDIIKDGDFFVCQSCGMKYTPDAAKKMMIEGTVTVDRSSELQNLYTLARRARVMNNISNALKYYNEIASMAPDDWEASFFSNYYQGLDCKPENIIDATKVIRNSLDWSLSLIKNSSLSTKEKSEAYSLVASSCISCADTFESSAYSAYRQNTDPHKTDGQYRRQRFACCNLLIECADLLVKYKQNEKAMDLYKHLIYGKYSICFDKEHKRRIYEKMKYCDPSFVIGDYSAFLSDKHSFFPSAFFIVCIIVFLIVIMIAFSL